MRGGLVRHDVGSEARGGDAGKHVGGVAEKRDRQRLLRAARLDGARDRLVEIGEHLVAVAGFEAPLDSAGIDFDSEADAAVHRDRQRLRAAHASQARGHDQTSREVAAETLPRALGKRLVGALQDSLTADVDPRSGRHLSVHGQAERVEAAELVPRRPFRHQVGVRDQHARRLLVRAEYTHRLSALDEERLVVGKPLERCDNRVIGRPVARGLAGAAVDDQIVGPLGDFRIEVVHQQPKCGFLIPASTASSWTRAVLELPSSPS